eukprot:Gb_37667 [translate_table: standard]
MQTWGLMITEKSPETNPIPLDFVFDTMGSSSQNSSLLLDDIYCTPMESLDYSDTHSCFQSDPWLQCTALDEDPFQLFQNIPAESVNSTDLSILSQIQTNPESQLGLCLEKQPIISREAFELGVHNNCKGLITPALPSQRRRSAFVEWKASGIVLQPPTPKSRSQCLLKRCIRLLNDMRRHRILSAPILIANPHGCSTGDGTHLVPTSNKLAIHHVIAERKRREQMNHIFSSLRALLPPLNPKKSRATILLQTKEYLIQLMKRIEELEQRNSELEEALLTARRSTGNQT